MPGPTRTLVGLLENLGSIFITHMVAYNYLQLLPLGFQHHFWPLWVLHPQCVDTHTPKLKVKVRKYLKEKRKNCYCSSSIVSCFLSTLSRAGPRLMSSPGDISARWPPSACRSGIIQPPEDQLHKLVLSLYHMGLGHKPWAIGLGSKHLFLLSHLTDSSFSSIRSWRTGEIMLTSATQTLRSDRVGKFCYLYVFLPQLKKTEWLRRQLRESNVCCVSVKTQVQYSRGDKRTSHDAAHL